MSHLKRSFMLLPLLFVLFALVVVVGEVVFGVMTALLRVLAVWGVPAELTEDGESM